MRPSFMSFVNVSFASVLREEGAVLCSFRDVTSQREVELELVKTKDFLQRVIDSSFDAIISADMSGRVLLFNRAAERIYGKKQSEVVGSDVRQLYPEGTAQKIMRMIRAGGGRIEGLKVEKPYLIPDEEAVPVIFDLLEHEGLCLGGSTGVNVAGAIRLARELGPGKTIVTMLCDSGNRYQSKLFNPDFMRSKNLPVPEWLEKRSKIEPPLEKV